MSHLNRMVVLVCATFCLFLTGCPGPTPPANTVTNTPASNTSAPPANTSGMPGANTATPPAAAAAAKDGWWIKVRKEKQESPTITFSIGSNNHTVEAWRTWHSGEPLEFDVPDKFKNINPLYIKAQSSGGRNSWFCMMYKGDGVKHFDFDDDEDHEEKQSNRDGECNFSN